MSWIQSVFSPSQSKIAALCRMDLLLHQLAGVPAGPSPSLRSPPSQLGSNHPAKHWPPSDRPAAFMTCVLTWICQPSLWAFWGANRFLHLRVNPDTSVFPLAQSTVLRQTPAQLLGPAGPVDTHRAGVRAVRSGVAHAKVNTGVGPSCQLHGKAELREAVFGFLSQWTGFSGSLGSRFYRLVCQVVFSCHSVPDLDHLFKDAA